MPNLPTDAIAAAQFIVRKLYRPIEVAAGSRYFAVAETCVGGGDDWFWSDDNAKVLEFMSRPEVWRRFPQETEEILHFIRSMCHGPFIFRRVAPPLLEPAGTAGSVSSYRHALMHLRCDLARGGVVAGVRFHDERNFDNLMLYGHYLEFSHRGRRIRQPVPIDGDKARVERQGHLLRLRHAGVLSVDAGGRRQRLGEVAYTYTFDATSMLFAVEAALDLDPGVELRDVVLTIAHGGLGYCFFDNVVTDGGADGRPLFAAGRPGSRLHRAAGAAYYAIRQAHISADALAIHSTPTGPQPLTAIETVVETQGRLDRVVARYEFLGRHRGARLVAAEKKLITAGGFYDRIADYAALMRAAAAASASRHAACDFSISYDYGVTANAVARCFAGVSAGTAAPAAPCADELRAVVDEILGHYFDLYVDRHERQPNAIYSRELAFAGLAAATMYRATGADDYRRRLARVCDVLLDLATPRMAFPMRKDNPQVYLDCQSAALLALTSAAPLMTGRDLAAPVGRGLAAYRIAQGGIDCGAAGRLDTVAVVTDGADGVEHSDLARWNFKAGLTLRFFAALRQSPVTALQAVVARHDTHIAGCEAVLRRQLARSVTEDAAGIAIRTSPLSAETNSETQPWAMLGLLGHSGG